MEIRKRKGMRESESKGKYGDQREKKESKGKSRSTRGRKIQDKTSQQWEERW